MEPRWEEYVEVSGYGVNAGNPVVYVDTSGDLPIAVAIAVGILVSAGTELFVQKVIEGREWSEINLRDIVISGIVGGVGGALGALKVGTVVGSAVGGAVGQLLSKARSLARYSRRGKVIAGRLIFIGFELGEDVVLGSVERAMKGEETTLGDVIEDVVVGQIGGKVQEVAARKMAGEIKRLRRV